MRSIHILCSRLGSIYFAKMVRTRSKEARNAEPEAGDGAQAKGKDRGHRCPRGRERA